MRITLWRSRYRQMDADPLSGAVPKGIPNEDPRAARYFARAGRINAIAAEMGYESLEHAIIAGRMREIFQRVSPPASDAAEGAHL